MCQERTFQVLLAKSWQNNFNITYQVTLNQPFTSQTSNIL